MKRILALMLTLMLLCTAALADAPSYSPEVTALKTAYAALREKYGFTLTTSGVFYPEVTITDSEARVVFRPCTFLPIDRLGEYTAVITGDSVTLTWSHDAQSANLTANPDCPIWGQAQLQTYFDQGVITRDAWAEKYISPSQEPQDAPDIYDGLDADWLLPVESRDIPREQLYQTARSALEDIYAMSPAEIDAMYIEANNSFLQCSDGREYWLVRSGDVNYFFTLLIDKATGELFRISLFSGGLG